MNIVYTGITESELARIIEAGGLTKESLKRQFLECGYNDTGTLDQNHIRKALADVLARSADTAPSCYVLELAVNECQVCSADIHKVDLDIDVDGVPGVPINRIINVYPFQLSHKLRTVGAILRSQSGSDELLEPFGINYLGESQNAFLEWFWRLNVKPPILGADFFDINTIPVAGLRVCTMHEIKSSLKAYAEAARKHADRVMDEGTLRGRLHIVGVGHVDISLDYFLEEASPITIAEVLRGNSREIVKYLEDVNPMCALASFADELLQNIVPGNHSGLVVEINADELHEVLLEKDPEKYSQVIAAWQKMNILDKGSSE
jgi:hypothetical protein